MVALMALTCIICGLTVEAISEARASTKTQPNTYTVTFRDINNEVVTVQSKDGLRNAQSFIGFTDTDGKEYQIANSPVICTKPQ